MTDFSQRIAQLDAEHSQIQTIKDKIEKLTTDYESAAKTYFDMVEALQLLATVSDETTRQILDYITGIINKTLAELFPHDQRRIKLERSIYAGQHAHINITLTGSDGKPRDLQLQSGTGLRQVISFLFTLSLIEVRKGRRILIADELLSGLHKEAKRIVMDIIRIFAEEGFQFIFVEYEVNDLGRIYLVEKPGKVASVTPMDGVYHNEVFKFNPPENVDMSVFVDESA